MKNLKLQCVIWKEGRHYVAQCLNVDVASFGATEKSARNNLQEALELYFEDVNSPKITAVENPELTKLSINYA